MANRLYAPMSPCVLNKKIHGVPKGAIYIGRPSICGNPFVIGRDGDRLAVIYKHQAWLPTRPDILRAIPALRGRDLVCFCAPDACHGHTFLYLANPDLRASDLWPAGLWPIVEPLASLAAALDALRAP